MHVSQAVKRIVGVGGFDAVGVDVAREAAGVVVTVGRVSVAEALVGDFRQPVERIVAVTQVNAAGVVGLDAVQLARAVVGIGQGALRRGFFDKPVAGVVAVSGNTTGVLHGRTLAADGVVVSHRRFAQAGVRGFRDQPVELVVGVGCRLAVEVGLADQVAGRVVGHVLGLAFRQGAADAPAHVVIGEGRGVAVGIGLAELVAALVVTVGRDLAERVGDGDQAAQGIVGKLGKFAGLIGFAGVAAQRIVAGEVLGAIRVEQPEYGDCRCHRQRP